MARVLVTGLGCVCSLGNDLTAIEENLRAQRHGLALYPPFQRADAPAKVVGMLKDFDTLAPDPEDWRYPSTYTFKRETLRSASPHVLYAHCALQQALADAKLSASDVSSPTTGLFTASAGSASSLYRSLHRMKTAGVMRSPPLGIVASVVGALNFNLVAHYKFTGPACGFASACASSAHALGFAWEEVAAGRLDRVVVVGAEDGDEETILPFAVMRTLSLQTDPDLASRPFDKDRDGFVGTGGAAVIVLENEASAAARGVAGKAEILGWGQASDGYNVAISHPEGLGLARAMETALKRSGLTPADIDHINAHATSTQIGDVSECRAILRALGPEHAARVPVASTKALTGHGISLAGALEMLLTVLAMRSGFTPGNPHLLTPDPACAGIRLERSNLPTPPKVALSNNSGFGGANVSIALRAL